LLATLYVPGASVKELGALQKFSSQVREKAPLPLAVSKPAPALGTPAPVPHEESPVR
jgi:hypothetical protein